MKLKKILIKFKKIEDTTDRKKLTYKTNGNTYDFRKSRTIRNFGKDIYEGEITLDETDKDQSDLLNEIKNFSDKTRRKSPEKKQEKKLLVITSINFIVQEKWFLKVLKAKYFQ